ncbi:MAG: S-layer homology domain-containing protein [Peptococcaceae bacterium]|nr:S-layer homology domain-containing protein [Peptococcaceae bacterium]
MSHLVGKQRGILCWVLMLAMILTMIPGAAFAADNEPVALSVSVTEIGETEATLTVTDNKGISGTKFAIYKVQKTEEPEPVTIDETFGFIEDMAFTSEGAVTTAAALADLEAGTAYTVYAAIAYFDNNNDPAYTEIVGEEFTTTDGSGGGSDEGGAMSLSYRRTAGEELITDSYEDYAAAVAAMNALDKSYTDVTLKLLSDINITLTQEREKAIIINRTCTLDLNGKILAVTGKGYVSVYGIYVEGEITFTLTDSSPEKSGELRCRSAYDIDAIAVGSNLLPGPDRIEDEVHFVMNGGTVTSKNPNTNTSQNGIYVAGFGEAELNGGRIEGLVMFYGKFTMNGGEIEGDSPVAVVVMDESALFRMTGGTILNSDTRSTWPSPVAAVSSYTALDRQDAIQISGGAISSINGPALMLNHRPSFSAGVSIKGNAVLRSGQGAAIAFENNFPANEGDKFNLSIEDSVALEGADRVIDLVFVGEADYLTVNVEEGVTLRYREGSLPIAPNSSYVTYPEGKVLDVKPFKSELVNGADYGTYALANKSDLGQKIGAVDWGYQHFDDLSTALAGAEPVYSAGNSAGKYDAALWSAFTAAYEAALPILQNANANQNEINYFTDALGAAQSAMIEDAEKGVDLADLPDGTYTVDIEMWNYSSSRLSMANSAVNPKARLQVKDGAASMTIGFRPIMQIGHWGSLMQFWAYKGNTPQEGFNNATVNSGKAEYLLEAEYPVYQYVDFENGTTTPIVGQPEESPKLTNEIRPASARIMLPYIGNANDYNKVYCYVGVDMMRSLDGKAVGDQPVILYIKYSTLQTIDVEATLSVDTSPVMLLPGSAQEVAAKVTGDIGWTISWSSDDESVATVENGHITAVGGGKAAITVRAGKEGEEDLVKTIAVTVAAEGAALIDVKDAGISGGIASASISGDTLVTAGGSEAVVNGKNTVTIDATITPADNIGKAVITLEGTAAQALRGSGKSVTIKTNMGNVTFDAAAMGGIAGADGAVILTIEKSAQVPAVNNSIAGANLKASYNLSLNAGSAGGANVSFGGGRAAVTVSTAGTGIPNNANNYYAYYIKDGKLLERQIVITNDNTASWTTSHFSTWAIIYGQYALDETGGGPGGDPGSTVDITKPGSYLVPVSLGNASSSALSMGDPAFDNNRHALIINDGSSYQLQLCTNPIKIDDIVGGIGTFHCADMSNIYLDKKSLPGGTEQYVSKVTATLDNLAGSYIITISVPGTPMVGEYDARLILDLSNAVKTSQTILTPNTSLSTGKLPSDYSPVPATTTDKVTSGSSITFPKLESYIEGGGVTVENKDAGIAAAFDAAALKAIADAAGSSDVKITVGKAGSSNLSDAQKAVVGDRPVFSLTVTTGSKTITDFGGGKVTVTLPYTLGADEDADGLVIYRVADDGSVEALPCTFNAAAKTISFTTGRFSVYMIAYDKTQVWENPFTDIAESAWYYDAVRYAMQNGLFAGTSETTFTPDADMTRAMLVTVLHRLDGKPAVTGKNIFADVKYGEWYADAILWANENKIVTGYGDGIFGTNDAITREQLAAILYRYAKAKGYDVTKTAELTKYTDVSSLSGWAYDAMKWANAEGLIIGTTDTTLSPSGTATRAQVAAILMRFAENIVK